MAYTMELETGSAVTLFVGELRNGRQTLGLKLSGTTDWAVTLTRSESLALARIILQRFDVTPIELDDLMVYR